MTLSLEKPNLSTTSQHRHDATWQDYVAIRDGDINWQKIAFNQGWLWADMGTEGPNHASFSDLLTMIFGFWAFLHPQMPLAILWALPDRAPRNPSLCPRLGPVQRGQHSRWQPSEPRRISLDRHRLPDLVGEIADTSLSLDLDEQKQLYAQLGIAEYWVVDVKGLRLFGFGLTATGVYEPIQVSQILTGLPISLVEQTLERLETETNTAAANWLMQQLQNAKA
jgi:hypothetical protein